MPHFTGAVITLPEDTMLRERLVLKLAEYVERESGVFDIEHFDHWNYAKKRVLEILLAVGVVEYDLLETHLGRIVGPGPLENGFGVIKGYVEGTEIFGGTGLPQLVAA